jgi:hypothetical protein
MDGQDNGHPPTKVRADIGLFAEFSGRFEALTDPQRQLVAVFLIETYPAHFRAPALRRRDQ